MLAFVLSEPEVVVGNHEVVVGDHDLVVWERAFLGGNPALEVAKYARMGAEHDDGGVDLESALGEERHAFAVCGGPGLATEEAARPQ